MLDCKSHLHPWHFDAKLQGHRLSLAWMQTMNFSTQFNISLSTAIGIQEVVPSDFSAQPRGSTRMSDATEPVEATNYPGHIWTKVPRHEVKSAQINMSKPSKRNTSTFLECFRQLTLYLAYNPTCTVTFSRAFYLTFYLAFYLAYACGILPGILDLAFSLTFI